MLMDTNAADLGSAVLMNFEGTVLHVWDGGPAKTSLAINMFLWRVWP
jgi:hypothetical protein